MAEILKLSFVDSVDIQSVRSFIENLKHQIEHNPQCDEIEISIATGGGEIDLAIELYNFLKALKCRITTINMSYVNSAGVLVFLAGDERICLDASSFFVHSVTKKLSGEYNYRDLAREVKEMRANTVKITRLLANHTLMPSSYWRRLMNNGSIITPDMALRIGLITKILKL